MDQVLNAIDNLSAPEKKEFLICAFKGDKLPVRILTHADLVEDPKGLPKGELYKPIIHKERTGKDKVQVMIDHSWRLENLLNGLEYLKSKVKIDFKTNPVLKGHPGGKQ